MARLEQCLEAPGIGPEGIAFEEIVADIEQSLIIKASDATHWNQSKTADILNLKRDKLRYRMKLYNLGRERNRERDVA